MPKCDFCHPDPDGTVACWNLDAAEGHEDVIGVASAEIFAHDGITVILRTPKPPNDQRLHITTLYCPMCGRRYGDAEVKNAE